MAAPSASGKDRPADYRTPLKRVRHYGASGHGVEHFIAQRVTAIALIVLAPCFLLCFAWEAREGREALAAWLGSPFGALLGLIFFAAACHHLRIGLTVIIEDYVSAPLRYACLILVTFLTVLLWAAVSLAILTLALGG